MANEATITGALSIVNGTFQYQSRPSQFLATVTGKNGPTPGAVTITTSGTTVSLSQLTALGGFCFLQNLDVTNYLTYGIYASATFYPFGELLPGEFAVVRLSRILQFGATGTAHVDDLRLQANTASVIAMIAAFDP